MRAILLFCFLAVCVSAMNMEKLKAEAMQKVEQISDHAKATIKFLEADLQHRMKQRQGAAAKAMICSGKLSWKKKADPEKEKLLAEDWASEAEGKAAEVDYESWIPQDTPPTTVSLYFEANAAVGAGLTASIGAGVGFEFSYTKGVGLTEASVLVCASAGLSASLTFGANAGGTIYLIFGEVKRMDDANFNLGFTVYDAIGGGIAFLFKADDATKAAIQKIWTDAKVPALAKGAKKEDIIAVEKTEKQSFLKNVWAAAKAAVVGVSFSAGVGVGASLPVAASWDVTDVIKKGGKALLKKFETKRPGLWSRFVAWKKGYNELTDDDS